MSMKIEDLSQEVKSWIGSVLNGTELQHLEIVEVPKGEFPSVGWGTTDLFGSNLEPEKQTVCFFPSEEWEKAETCREVSHNGVNTSWEDFLLGRRVGRGGMGIIEPTLYKGLFSGREAVPAEVGYTQEHPTVLRLRLFLPDPARKTRRQEKKEARKRFAQEQFDFLRDKGLSAKLASRIMREAGPG